MDLKIRFFVESIVRQGIVIGRYMWDLIKNLRLYMLLKPFISFVYNYFYGVMEMHIKVNVQITHYMTFFIFHDLLLLS